MKMTKAAIEVLTRIVVSCDPVAQHKSRENEKFLIQCLKQDEDKNFNQLCEGLVEGYAREEKIFELAKKMGKDVVDEEVIFLYFGGLEHIAKTLNELEKEKLSLSNPIALYLVFIHNVTPVTVTAVDVKRRRFCGVYQNGEIRVEIKNLIMLERDAENISKGMVVLTHYPLLINMHFSGDISRGLLEEQIKSPEFLMACKFWSARVMDHEKLNLYCKQIEKTIEKYQL